MGLDNQAVNFLRYASKIQPLGTIVTLGRQELHVTGKLAKFYKLDRSSDETYAEDFLRCYFGAIDVVSLDNSDYEGATHIVDMNQPVHGFPEFDTIIDAGTLEHIYNVPQALSNIAALCREGGQIIHILPANNECGHGFWQFSPELFYSLYSDQNGYVDTCVYIASRDDEKYWYEVKKPSLGDRAYIQSLAPLSVLCRTRKSSRNVKANVQQSDYAYVWTDEAQSTSDQINKPTQGAAHSKTITWLKTKAWKLSGLSTSMLTLLRVINFLFISKTGVSERNPHLTKRAVNRLAPLA